MFSLILKNAEVIIPEYASTGLQETWSHSKSHNQVSDLFSAGEQVNSALNLIMLLLQGQELETFCIFQYQTHLRVNLIWITDWI